MLIPPLELEKAVAADKVSDSLLDCLEAHGTASLALEMVDDGSQSLEVLVTAPVGAVIQGLAI